VRSYQTVSKLRPLVSLVPRSLRKRLRERLLGQKDEGPVAPPLPQSTGVTVVGYIHRPTGVGQSARLAAASFEEVDVVVAMADVDADESMDPDPAFPVSVFHVNADQALHVRNTRPSLFATGYRIACWHWELPEFPDAWIPSAAPFDEIWAPSLFVLSAVSRKVSIPVIHMPHGLEVTEIETVSLELFGVPPGRFTFLCMFDLDSVMDRKNPMGAIDAFRRAFPDASSEALLIKTTGADRHPEQFSELVRSLAGVPGIHILNRTMTRAQANGLVAACDGVVSLHRSEGFGLVPAEAMALGKPVIATGWSGNMDFMNASNSCPIDYELVTLENDVSVYTRGQRWAEPDLEHAATMLRRVATDEAFRARIGARAADTMRTEFSPRAAGQRMKARLQTLGLLR
jgi:glycosyltransferase involved in cell wall biosynthesis